MAMGKEMGMDRSDSHADAEIPLDDLIESTMPSGIDKASTQQSRGGLTDYAGPTYADGMAVPIDELIKKTKPE